jgi:hypothetical protein
MLRKAEEHFTNQRQFEAENLARLETARRIRQEERDRQDALEASLIFFSKLVGIYIYITFLASTNGRVTE